MYANVQDDCIFQKLNEFDRILAVIATKAKMQANTYKFGVNSIRWRHWNQGHSLNSLPSKFELHVPPHSAKKMSLHMPSCALNDSTFWCFLRLWAATLYWGILLDRSLCRLEVFTSTIEENMAKRNESRMQNNASYAVVVLLSANCL